MTECEQIDFLRSPNRSPDLIHCVYLTPLVWEFAAITGILRFSSIRAIRADTLDEADFVLTVTGADVLLCDITFIDGTWRDALRLTQVHPNLELLLVADPVDAPSLGDTRPMGIGEIVWKPVEPERAVSAIRRSANAALQHAIERREQLLRDIGTAGS